MVAEALKQSNNNPERSYYLLTAEPDIIRLAVNNSKPPYIPNEEDISEIMIMGFTRPQAVGTLKLTRGDLTSAVEKLLQGEGREEIEPVVPVVPLVPLVPLDPLDPIALPSTTEPLPVDEDKEKNDKEEKLLKDAEYELIGDHEEDPLLAYDIDLTQEAQMISQFSTLINSSF